MRPIRLTALAVLAGLSLSAAAQTYPARPISMIVNFPPGGATDLAARALSAAMGPTLNQPIVIENRAGAGGSIGVGVINAAPKDGYHIGFIAVAALTTLPQIRKVPYQIDSVDYICQAFDLPVFMLSTQESRFKSVRELVSYAKTNPGKVNYATVGPGSLPHMAAMDFARKAEVELTHIPFQGEAPAVTNLLGGHVDLYFGTNAVATTHNLRRLSVATDKRVPEALDTPTLKELGYPVSWSIKGGVILPVGVDVRARQALEQACKTAVAGPQYRSVMQQMKMNVAYASGEDFKSAVLAESGKNRVLLREAGLLAP